MLWTSDSVLSGVPFYVFLWCGDMHRNYTFSLCSGLPTYDAVTPNVYVARGQRMLLFQRLPNVNVYMVAGFGALALEGDDFLLASLAF